MSTPANQVFYEIECADATLAVLSAVLRENMHKDDCAKYDKLIDRARGALNKASAKLADTRRFVQDAIDSL